LIEAVDIPTARAGDQLLVGARDVGNQMRPLQIRRPWGTGGRPFDLTALSHSRMGVYR
jgi:hypothetical protein